DAASFHPQPCFKVLSKTSTIITLVFLLLSIVVVVAVTLVQINHKDILSPGLKVYTSEGHHQHCNYLFAALAVPPFCLGCRGSSAGDPALVIKCRHLPALFLTSVE
uniref:Uncharacterized protein n=1 Tax=Gopherus evgoodei TaxID=1825980 RepID=A0A8C4YSB2_9SAUR